MIKLARVSVDDATKDILDELSAQLYTEPTWAKNHQIAIEEAVRLIFEETLTPLKLLLENSFSGMDAKRRHILHTVEEVQIRLDKLTDQITSQCNQLTYISHRIEELSLPWWKKIFKKLKGGKNDK